MNGRSNLRQWANLNVPATSKTRNYTYQIWRISVKQICQYYHSRVKSKALPDREDFRRSIPLAILFEAIYYLFIVFLLQLAMKQMCGDFN